MGTVQRLHQFIENKGISKYRFYQESGLSNGSLDKGENIGSDKCEKILYAFPDLNSDWLLTGRGPMLKSDAVLINEPEMTLWRQHGGIPKWLYPCPEACK